MMNTSPPPSSFGSRARQGTAACCPFLREVYESTVIEWLCRTLCIPLRRPWELICTKSPWFHRDSSPSGPLLSLCTAGSGNPTATLLRILGSRPGETSQTAQNILKIDIKLEHCMHFELHFMHYTQFVRWSRRHIRREEGACRQRRRMGAGPSAAGLPSAPRRMRLDRL